jgi:methylated-DNA-[protein]-cysteine S-methyltransferase
LTNRHLLTCPSCRRRQSEAERVYTRLRRREPEDGQEEIVYGALLTPLGLLWIARGPRGIVALDRDLDEARFYHEVERARGGMRYAPHELRCEFRQIEEYVAGKRYDFDLTIDLSACSPFRRRVLEAVCEVPWGRVASYGEIGRQLGVNSGKAVGGAIGGSPISIVVPCHRVIRSGGTIGEYGGGRCGAAVKAALLAHEGWEIGEAGTLSRPDREEVAGWL